MLAAQSLLRPYNGFSRNNFPFSMEGCVFYAPLWQEDVQGSPFLSYDQYLHTCTVTGAIGGSQGRTFDGIDDNIACGNAASLQFANNFTVSIWIKWGAAQVRDIRAPLSKGHNEFGGWALQSIGPGATVTSFTYRIGGGYQTVDFTGYLSDNTAWACLTVVKSSVAGVVLYKDGSFLNSNAAFTGDITDPTVHNLTIGKDTANADRNFTGQIGEVLIYSRALSAGEIQQRRLATMWRYAA